MAVEHERVIECPHRLVVGELVGIGIDEKLAGQHRAAPVADPQRHRRGQVPPGAVTADREPGGVPADLRRVPGDPAHRRVAVVDRRREGVLGRQPVTNHGDQRAG